MTGDSFGRRLQTALAEHGPLCVGIDPHPAILDEWGLPTDAGGVRDFGLRVVDAAAGRVGVIKPQVALFEQFGATGFTALEAVLAAARETDLLVIADAKRGDIGSTMTGYARAWLSDDSPLSADAVTLSPYLGPDSLVATVDFARAHGRGAFVLAATSNVDSRVLQTARTAQGSSVAATVAAEVSQADPVAESELGSIGLVIGATNDREDFGLTDDVLASRPILAPGFGAQGAAPADLPKLFGQVAGQVIAAESRSVLAGERAKLAQRIADRVALYRDIELDVARDV